MPGAGQTQRLPRLIGPANAMWLLLSAERIKADERGDETGGEVTSAQGQQLRVVIAFDGHRNRIAPVGRPLAGARLLVERCVDDPLASRQFGLSEEAGTTFAHRQQRPTQR